MAQKHPKETKVSCPLTFLASVCFTIPAAM